MSFGSFGRLAGKVPPLVPGGVKVVLLADRGFADTQLMKLITQMGWHFRIRIKANFWVYQPDKPRCQVRNFYLSKGQTVFLHGVSITDKQHGPVHLALAYHSSHDEYWYLVSSEPTNCQTFVEYGLRFDIEENFLDDKSNGFQLEKSAIRNADALCRLCLNGDDHPFSGFDGDSSGRLWEAALGRSPLVSRFKLSAHWLAMDKSGLGQRVAILQPPGIDWWTGSGASHCVSKTSHFNGERSPQSQLLL